MKTIIQGNKDLLKEYKYFYCDRCTWTGKAERKEYIYCGNQIEGDEWKVECPCCGAVAYSIQDKKKLAVVQAEERKIEDADYWERR